MQMVNYLNLMNLIICTWNMSVEKKKSVDVGNAVGTIGVLLWIWMNWS